MRGRRFHSPSQFLPVNRVDRSRLRNPDWDIEEGRQEPKEADRPTRENTATLHVKCPSCAFPFTVQAMPWSKLWTKTDCPHCEYVFEVKTRDSTMDYIEEQCALQDDMTKVRDHPKGFAGTRGVGHQSSARTVVTRFGRAYEIG